MTGKSDILKCQLSITDWYNFPVRTCLCIYALESSNRFGKFLVLVLRDKFIKKSSPIYFIFN